MPQIEEAQPKYLQIAHFIRDQILRGDLRPGDEVPSERQLAADWKVSRPTAARSLEALSHQGPGREAARIGYLRPESGSQSPCAGVVRARSPDAEDLHPW
ncbi:hypothetical protein GCM10017687_13100 [Streptomyces echinatus]